ncbi:MAG: DUF1553 domain-containing protein [Pirellulaceae bacterium]
MRRALLVSMILAQSGAASLAAAAERTPTYNRDIRAILSDKCFACHGPDAAKREADLRLDQREGAVASGAIVPGDAEASEVMRRVLSDDADVCMPPPAAKLGRLTATEADLLSRWIAAGAQYESHWSFIPLRPVDVPTAAVGTSPIDALVAARLAEVGMTLQPEAPRTTLIRRLSFDLTGLPPTPEEIERFLADRGDEAYERLVDRLLASPRFGERMAVDWLDIARYADSYGFQVDRERDVWMWRDWVVRAFNRNQPFDEFVTWQLAGDLLPHATDEQVLATAFNRLHQQESEGGSVEEEYRVEYVCDRVQTFATAFLGLTFECARCHDHKYDPVLQREYYGLFSMFQNIDEAGLYSYFTQSPPTPTLLLADPSAKEKLAGLDAEIARGERQRETVRQQRRTDFEAWRAMSPRLQLPGERARFDFDALDNNQLANAIDAAQPAVLKGENRLVPGHRGQAVEFTGDDPVDLKLGNFQRYEPFSIALWLRTPDVKERAVVFHRSRAWTDAASRGYELLIEDGRLKWSLIHFWPGNAASIRAQAALPPNEWVHVVVTSDGSSRAAGLGLFVNGGSAATDTMRDSLTKNITGGGGEQIALGERFRDRGFKGGAIDEFRVWDRELTALEVDAIYREIPAETPLTAETLGPVSGSDRLFDYYLATVDSVERERRDQLRSARAAQSALVDSIPEIMVMRELPQPKPAYVLFRGEYNQRRDPVPPATPASLSPFPSGTPRNRLGLARWLTDPGHPLMARVTVNRFWASLFGAGLVKTTEDFGSQGDRPRHPELLDWLAWRFIDKGWDVKDLLKTIVMSRTYRQRSTADGEAMKNDPENEWLARGPRFRLPAEMIRDNALAAAGLLDLTEGGPPVNPYEMAEAFKPAKVSDGAGLFRRSLYTTWRRTSPPPALLTFDAPRRAVCASRRERTGSPLQALILLNGVQYVEAARVLGEKLYLASDGDVGTMIEQGFLRCLGRRPDDRERAICAQLYAEQRTHFTDRPAAAEALLKVGQSPRQEGIPQAAAAAAAALAQVLLNHDECVVKR